MLISSKKDSKRNKFSFVKYGIGALAIIGLGFLVYPEVQKWNTIKDSSIVWCDAEMVRGTKYISNGKTFSGGATQSDEEAYSGKYSSKLPKSDHPVYGMSYSMNAEVGEVYKLSVWRKWRKKGAESFLVFSGKDGKDFYKSKSDVFSKNKEGWGQIIMYVKIPESHLHQEVVAYTYSNGAEAVYFDDMKIEKLDNLPAHASEILFEAQHIDIEFSEKNFKKLKQKRQEAIQNGLIITDEDSWVKATIQESGTEEKIPVKLRLKGDWLDHVNSDKWSFRIKVKDPFAWNRLKTFSVHTPKARYYVLEWLLHEFWKREGVLTTRYDFVTLSVNGEHKGIYAYEEHFEKQLLEYQNRREGPIIRFSEDALWDARQRHLKLHNGQSHARRDVSKMPTANIKPFQENKIATSPTLSAQYEIAQNLLYQYQNELMPSGEIFDLDLMAKYTVIVDMLGAYHGVFWHNQRYYYNPVISKLEPIGFDGLGLKPRRDPLVLGKALLENEEHKDHGPLRKMYNDPEFIERYMFYLNKFTEADYFEKFYAEIENGLMARVEFLKDEFPEFEFEKQRILNRINQIRFRLFPYSEHSVKATWKTDLSGNKKIQLSNSHELPLEVVGLGIYPDWLRDTFKTKIHLPGHRIGYKMEIQEVNANSDAKFVFYKPYGIDSLFTSSISSFSMPDGKVPIQKLFANKTVKSNSFFKVFGNTIVFQTGKYVWDKDVVIPKGYKVIFEAGVQVDILKKSKFVSRSPIYLKGTNEEPIVIYSSDHSANGFTVLQAPETSEMYYTIFKDLNTLNYEGWTLTGAVTFYESDVTIKNCMFKNNHCEDALNTIRCSFRLENSTIENTFSDGFDADFCTGRVD